MKNLFILFQQLVPQHLLSRLVGKLAECRWPWLKNFLIERFIDHFDVDMAQAAEPDPRQYAHFNAFFTRELAEGQRPITDVEGAVACPADGAISQLGTISEQGHIFQAKGHHFNLTELLGGDEADAKAFAKGQFATIYLSPRDYHRVHMPVSGSLTKMIYIPGDLFSVNTTTAENIHNLFARNERAVCLFDTELGPMAVILVGAMIVAGIETVWAGQIAPQPRKIITQDYTQKPDEVVLQRGDELGRFKLGSTAIVLFGKDAIKWREDLAALSPTTMGELIAR